MTLGRVLVKRENCSCSGTVSFISQFGDNKILLFCISFSLSHIIFMFEYRQEFYREGNKRLSCTWNANTIITKKTQSMRVPDF
jgi:hypothetical protein